MRRLPLHDLRVLALDPFTRGIGFIVLEGPEEAVDWGTKRAGKNKNIECLRQISYLIERYRPNVIVVEDCQGKESRRRMRVRKLTGEILRLASTMHIKSMSFSQSEVREAFAESGALTKHQIAVEITRQLPELTPRLPPSRKPWMSEGASMNIFDAAALALTFFRFYKKRKQAA